MPGLRETGDVLGSQDDLLEIAIAMSALWRAGKYCWVVVDASHFAWCYDLPFGKRVFC
jgi:hypothetical protein